MIDWSAFSWEAFATLVTGLVAVVGAVLIGRRQVAISDRQSRILEHQAKIDAARLRSELFERRYEVYVATSEFLKATLIGSGRPQLDIERRFLVGKDAAKFLFVGDVADQLESLYQDCNKLISMRGALERTAEWKSDYDASLPDKESQQSAKLSDRLASLASLFGDQLQISDVATLG